MFTNKLFIGAFLALSLLLAYGCSSETTDTGSNTDNKVDTTDLALQNVTAAKGESKINYKFEKGETFSYKLALLNEYNTEIKGDTTMSSKVNQRNIIIVDFKVLETENDSIAEIEAKIRNIDFFAASEKDTMKYHTGGKIDSTMKDEGEFYEGLASGSCVVRVDKLGNIIETYKFDKIVEKLLTFQPDSLMKKQENKDLMKTQMEGAVKSTFASILGQIFRQFSDGTIKSDTAYVINRPTQPDPSGLFSLVTTYSYKLKNKGTFDGKNVLQVDAKASGTYNINPEAKANGIDFKSTKFEGGGDVYFNEDDGKIVKSKAIIHETISVSLPSRSPRGGTTLITQTRSTKTTNIVEKLK